MIVWCLGFMGSSGIRSLSSPLLKILKVHSCLFLGGQVSMEQEMQPGEQRQGGEGNTEEQGRKQFIPKWQEGIELW